MAPDELDFYRQAVRGYRQPIHRVLMLGADKTPRAGLHQLFDRAVRLVVLDTQAGAPGAWVGPPHGYARGGWDGGLFDVLVGARWLERDSEWARSLASCAQLVRPGGLVLLTSAILPGPVVPVLDGAAVHGRTQVHAGPWLSRDDGLTALYHGMRQGPQQCLGATGYPVEAGKEHSSSHDADADGVVRLVRVRPPGQAEVVGRGSSTAQAAEQALVLLGLRKLLG